MPSDAHRGERYLKKWLRESDTGVRWIATQRNTPIDGRPCTRSLGLLRTEVRLGKFLEASW